MHGSLTDTYPGGRAVFKSTLITTWTPDTNLPDLAFKTFVTMIGTAVTFRSGSFLDRSGTSGARHRYRLQSVDLDGSRHWAGAATVS